MTADIFRIHTLSCKHRIPISIGPRRQPSEGSRATVNYYAVESVDRNGPLPIRHQIGLSYGVEKKKNDAKCVDPAIRPVRPVEKPDSFDGTLGSDCSIQNVFEAHRIFHHRTKHTTPHRSLRQLRWWFDCY